MIVNAKVFKLSGVVALGVTVVILCSLLTNLKTQIGRAPHLVIAVICAHKLLLYGNSAVKNLSKCCLVATTHVINFSLFKLSKHIVL